MTRRNKVHCIEVFPATLLLQTVICWWSRQGHCHQGLTVLDVKNQSRHSNTDSLSVEVFLRERMMLRIKHRTKAPSASKLRCSKVSFQNIARQHHPLYCQKHSKRTLYEMSGSSNWWNSQSTSGSGRKRIQNAPNIDQQYNLMWTKSMMKKAVQRIIFVEIYVKKSCLCPYLSSVKWYIFLDLSNCCTYSY